MSAQTLLPNESQATEFPRSTCHDHGCRLVKLSLAYLVMDSTANDERLLMLSFDTRVQAYTHSSQLQGQSLPCSRQHI